MDLLSRLEVFGRSIKRRYPYINCGGCAVYASAMVQALSSIGVGAFAAVCNEPETFEENRFRTIDEIRSPRLKSARHWNSVGLDFDHVITEFLYQGVIYQCDSDIIQESQHYFDGYNVLEGRLFPEEIILIANDGNGDWNHEFNRNLIPDIHRMFCKEFKTDIH